MDDRKADSKKLKEKMTPEQHDEENLYKEWCLFRLSVDFPYVGVKILRKALRGKGGKLSSTYNAVKWEFHRAQYKDRLRLLANKKLRAVGMPEVVAEDTWKSTWQIDWNLTWLSEGELELMKRGRGVASLEQPNSPCLRFETDWSTLQKECQRDWSALEGGYQRLCNLDHQSSKDQVLKILNEAVTPAVPVNDPFGCGCCYGEFSFEELLQCADGHLFCTDCLRRHFENYVFGASSQQACGLPPCMDMDGCDKSFPWSEVKKAVPEDALTKFEQRQGEISVAKAKLEGLVYCPSCNHPWDVEVNPERRILVCGNEACRKVSCIDCKEPDHHPKCCAEIEKSSETSLRTSVEELMSKALIRECVSCRAELVKIDGCNKIVCRCGQKMCYMCRKAIKNYSHFCAHVREPGLSCTECSLCSLWQREDEVEVVEKAKQVAMQEVTLESPALLKRDIGPSEVTLAMPDKKARVSV